MVGDGTTVAGKEVKDKLLAGKGRQPLQVVSMKENVALGLNAQCRARKVTIAQNAVIPEDSATMGRAVQCAQPGEGRHVVKNPMMSSELLRRGLKCKVV